MKEQNIPREERDAIYNLWQSGRTISELSHDFKRSHITIKSVVVDFVGKDNYKEAIRTRIGGASQKRKANVKYPDWMRT